MHRIQVLLAVLVCSAIAEAQQKPEVGVGLTVYNDNFAVVKERRQMDFSAGINTVRFTDVAAAIDPTSVSFECLSAPGAISILEQNYQYDLANTAALLKKYIDKEVNITVKGSGSSGVENFYGTLISAQDQNLIIQELIQDKNGKFTPGKLVIINRNDLVSIVLAELPRELLTKPTLVWLAQSKASGNELCQVTYTTEQINWKADYSAILGADEATIDLTGWVTIDNKSGADYNDAVIKLVAGDVRRVQEMPRPVYKSLGLMRQSADGEAAGFEEKAFMEYHLYTLGRKSSVHDNEVKQIELIAPASNIPVKKLYIFERQASWQDEKSKGKVQVKLEFENTKENHLGIALPKGKVRVFKRDSADGMLEFVGEDEIDHTAMKEKLKLYIGNAFDIVADYKLLNSKSSDNRLEQTHQVELKNRKDTAVTVFVDEKFTRYAMHNWVIADETHEFKKEDAQTARFTMALPADSTVTLRYTTIETW